MIKYELPPLPHPYLKRVKNEDLFGKTFLPMTLWACFDSFGGQEWGPQKTTDVTPETRGDLHWAIDMRITKETPTEDEFYKTLFLGKIVEIDGKKYKLTQV